MKMTMMMIRRAPVVVVDNRGGGDGGRAREYFSHKQGKTSERERERERDLFHFVGFKVEVLEQIFSVTFSSSA